VRVTKKDIDVAIERLNELTKNKYYVQGAYGGYQLVRLVNGVDTRDGVENIGYGFIPAKDFYYLINAMCRLLEKENRP